MKSAEELPWFKCQPTKFLQALAAMPPDLGYTYVIICFRIYEKRGPIQDDDRALARRTGFRAPHVHRLVDELVRLEKLVRTDAGLMNPFAEREITKTADKVARVGKVRSDAAKSRWEKSEAKQRRRHAKRIQPDADIDSEISPKGEIHSAAKTDWPDDYQERFWNGYPPSRRVDKKAAMAILDRIKKSGKVPWALFAAGMVRHAASSMGKPAKFVKHPKTWLAGECWNNPSESEDTNGAVRGSGEPGAREGYSNIAAAFRSRRMERDPAAGVRGDDGPGDSPPRLELVARGR